MRDQGVIFQQNYIQFVFNGGAETVAFSNYEVLGDLEYVPEHTQEIQQGENGKSFSLMRKQQEYFAFTIDYDKTATRKKVEKLRNYIRQGYELSFVVPAYPTIFDDYEFYNNLPTSSDPEVQTISITFGKAVIELPEDFAFDRGARGEGMTIVRQIPVRVLKSATLPVPVSECSLVSISDFDLNPWNVDAGTNELISVIVDVDPTGLIDTIDSRPDGTVTYVSGGSGQGDTSENMTWNAVQSRYEPVSGPFILDGIYTVSIPNIAITLNSGQECTVTFTQSMSYTINTGPEAQSVTISGFTQVGEELTLTWTYYDAQGDLQDTTQVDEEVWFSFPTLTEAQNGDLTNATQLGTGDAYTIGSGIDGEYIAARVKPYALTGTSPGDVVFSNVLGPVLTGTAAFTYNTTKSGTHDLIMQFDTAIPLGIDWGDGDFTVTTSALSTLTTYSHEYADGTSKTVTVYCDPDEISVLRLSGQSISGTVDIDALTSLVDFQAFGESAMTAINVPAAPIEKFYAYSSGITSLDFPSGVNFNNADIRIYSCSSLASLTFTGTAGTILVLFAYSTAIGTTLTLDGLEFSSGQLYLNNNPSLRAISTTGCTGTITRFRFYSCDIQGDFNFVPEFSGTVQIRGNNNSSMTDFTMNTTSSPKPNLQQFELQNCGLTNNPDLSGFNVAAGTSLNLSNNSAVTGINFGTGNSGAITILTVPATSFEYVSLGGYTFTENCNIDMRDCGMTAAIVNEWLYNMDGSESGAALLPTTGTGTIKMEGTNAAPDGSSGGFDGVTSASNISGDGYTLTTTP